MIQQRIKYFLSRFTWAIFALIQMSSLAYIQYMENPLYQCSIFIEQYWIGWLQLIIQAVSSLFFPTLISRLKTYFDSIPSIAVGLRDNYLMTRIINIFFILIVFIIMQLIFSQTATFISFILAANHYSEFLSYFLPSSRSATKQGLVSIFVMVQVSISSPFCWTFNIIDNILYQFSDTFVYSVYATYLISLCITRYIYRKFIRELSSENQQPVDQISQPIFKFDEVVTRAFRYLTFQINKDFLRVIITFLIMFLCIWLSVNYIVLLEFVRINQFITIEAIFVFFMALAYIDIMKKLFLSYEDAYNTLQIIVLGAYIIEIANKQNMQPINLYFSPVSIVAGIQFTFPLIIPQYFEEILSNQLTLKEIESNWNALPIQSEYETSDLGLQIIQKSEINLVTIGNEIQQNSSYANFSEESSSSQSLPKKSKIFTPNLGVVLFLIISFFQLLYYLPSFYESDLIAYFNFGSQNIIQQFSIILIPQAICQGSALILTIVFRLLVAKIFYPIKHEKD